MSRATCEFSYIPPSQHAVLSIHISIYYFARRHIQLPKSPELRCATEVGHAVKQIPENQKSTLSAHGIGCCLYQTRGAPCTLYGSAKIDTVLVLEDPEVVTAA